MAKWEDDVEGRPAGMDVVAARGRRHRPAASVSPAERRLLPRPGLRADETRPSSSDQERPRKTSPRLPPRTAQRPEPAVQRPGPLVQGHVRADRVQGRGRPRRRPARTRRSSSSSATADFGDAPETPLEPNFDDKSKKKRVTGPVELRHRRQGRHGLGHRRRARPPQSAAQGRLRPEKPIAFPAARDAQSSAEAEPRRLEQRRQP